ncbi:MAG: type III pantothenate kinase [Paludibacteraceae bacterium]
MNLVIDRGNTRAKFALFNDRQPVSIVACDRITDEFLQNFVACNAIDTAIYCSVAGDSADAAVMPLLQRRLPHLMVMPRGLRFPLSFDYNLDELGADRIAAAVGARTLVPEGNLFVVDAGTCITYDFVSADNKFEVGNIAPGYEMRLRAMHEFTGKLPLLEPTRPTAFMAQSTDEAMRAGAFNGVLFEIEGYLEYFRRKNTPYQLVLTGGTSILLHNQIKNCTFAEPNLVLIGLNEILIQNSK